MTRLSWISGAGALTQKSQCTLAGVDRATMYARRKTAPIVQLDVLLERLIPRRVQRLMHSMGLTAIAPGPNTSRAYPKHKVRPYLLPRVTVVMPCTSTANLRSIKVRAGAAP